MDEITKPNRWDTSDGANEALHCQEIALERALSAGPAEGGTCDVADKDVPVVDLQVESAEKQLWHAATKIGFFQVKGHSISQQTIDDMFALAERFFSLSRSSKELYPLARHHNAGYEFFEQVRPSTGVPDQKESFQVTARPEAMHGRWPEREVPGFEQTCRRFIDEAFCVGCSIMGMVEQRCGLPEGTLASAHNLWADDCQTTLRLLHYPPVEDPDALPKNYFRAGAHTDWDCITLLFQREGEVGLECAANPRADPGAPISWAPVDPVRGAIAVNIGDMLMRWSDDMLFSNLHRVRMPRREEGPPRSRYSLALFLQADKGMLVQGSKRKHPAVTAGDYILSRIRSNYAANHVISPQKQPETQQQQQPG